MPTTLTVDGMSCGGCESNVENAVSELEGCTAVEANHEADTVTVTGTVDQAALRATIKDAGYEPEA